MSLLAQLRALVAAIGSPLRVRKRTAVWIAVFVIASALLVGLTSRAAWAVKDDVLVWLLRLILPERWREVGGVLVKAVLANKLQVVVANAVIGGSLFLLNTVLLPIRERVSVVFELDGRLVDEPMREDSFLHFALDVILALLVFATAQMLIFAIGYSPSPSRRAFAGGLSYFFLFASCAMDLVPPLLLRHQQRTAAAFAALMRHPVLTLAFGALFVAPGLLAAHADLPQGQRLVAIVAANVVGILWGTLGGTLVGARLLDDTRRHAPPSLPTRVLAWITLVSSFSVGAYVVAMSARAIEHKTQLLKCHYHVVPSTVSVDLPRLGALLHAQVSTTARATLEIENPTQHDVGFENTRLEIGRGGATVARLSINPGTVRAGEKATYPISAPVTIDVRELKAALGRTGQWDVTLYVEVAPGVELPVYLKNARPD